jgi:zinc protease
MPSRTPALLVPLLLLLSTGLPARALAEAPPAPPTRPPHLAFETYQLANGLTVILHEDHTVPLVGVHVEYNVGSKDEKPHRTGFAHLFEHLMFEGSEHLPKGVADRLRAAAGASDNGQTSDDATVYWEQAPSNALDQMLYIEADRMGWLLPTLDQQKLDNQREVVLNERRQSYENRPYGLAILRLMAALWNPEFPYHWMPIGSREDVEQANLGDVREFFERWYGPDDAVLSIAGDFDPGDARRLVEKWFGSIPSRGRPIRQPPVPIPLTAEKRITMEDRVQLPRLYLAWQTPRVFADGDAALDLVGQILADGKSARLTRRLEMKEQIAAGVYAGQSSRTLGSDFLVVATPKPGVSLERLEREIDEEIARLAASPPSPEELTRARNKILAGEVFGLEPVGGSGGQSATLAAYYLRAGDPGYLEKDLARYRDLTAEDVSAAARTWLRKDARVVLQVVPTGTADAPATTGTGGAP